MMLMATFTLRQLLSFLHGVEPLTFHKRKISNDNVHFWLSFYKMLLIIFQQEWEIRYCDGIVHTRKPL